MISILGIDPGSKVTGWGILAGEGNRIEYIASGEIKLKGKDYFVRLGEIYRGISEVCGRYSPKLLAIEEVFMGKNWRSALKLGQARGVAILSAIHRGLEVLEFAPRQIKMAVAGSGRATKTQVQEMIRILLGLTAPLGEDESDALAVAFCGITKKELPYSLR